MAIRVLVVDDDVVNRTMISRSLSQKGFQVLTALDGEEALKKAKEEKPELVISDMLLPRIDGLELCSRIKEDPDLASTRVILMTAVYKTASVRAEALAQKADAYLEKPVSAEELLKIIDSLF